METVSFITTEAGDDLILSFAVQVPDDRFGIESLILLRTLKYEFIFDEHERGVSVSFERQQDETEDFLAKFQYSKAEAVVRIQTSSHECGLDVRRLDSNDLKKMRRILKKMNFDQKFETSGI